MFTNWLTGTGTTGLTNSNTRLNELNPSGTTNIATTGSLSLLNNHNLTNFNSNIMTTPPDVILEVGPGPSSMRFMAHGLVLGMHSGYLRSAIRLDERTATAAASAEGHGSAGGGMGPNTSSDIIVYLTNVTAEQFAPLLTYMYTGYLDLNVENIFGVLLATHVLHMPRALEICRSYLARAQTEGYFGPNNNSNLNASNSLQNLGLAVSGNGASKIIRPIASKPQLGNFGFLPLNHAAAAPSSVPPLNTISSNHNSLINNTAPLTGTHDKRSNRIETPPQKDNEDDDIEVDEIDKQSLNNENYQPLNDIHNNNATTEEDEEDVEVFIDSNSEAEVVVETEIQKLCFKKLNNNNKKCYQEKATTGKSKSQRHGKSQHHHHHASSKNERRKKSSSGLQVAKAPIPASQLDNSEANKVIIDVASCDGPVRFKRILNTAYGHKPEMCAGNSLTNRSGLVERSLQSVSLSFHQQMAKTISQQQQLQQAEESENSETSNGSLSATNARSCQDKATGSSSSSGRKIQSEVFVCVYCKHTFKSQYCYQKHAKRHLNPLTLQATCVPDSNKAKELKEETKVLPSVELQITKHANVNTTTRAYYSRSATQFSGSTNTPTTPRPLQSSSSAASSVDYLRREVRPLDMNVQYYPCKTCGSKFPSYYFVHKHRKMCHADEEAQQQQSNLMTTSGAAGTGASDNTTNSSNAASGSANVNPEECLNSQSSD